MIRISQREARRLRKQVAELVERENARNNIYLSDYPGKWLCDVEATPAEYAIVRTARLLEHAVCVQPANGKLRLYASPVIPKAVRP